MWMIFPILFLSFFGCESKRSDTYYPLEGKWKDIKSDDVYEKNRKEVLFDIQRNGDEYNGRVLSLDNAVESNGEIRKCSKCLNASGEQMLLGFPILQKLVRKENGEFSGKMYDIQQRKWFDIVIKPQDENRIKIRVYANVKIFGKSFIWERGEKYYKTLLSDQPSDYTKPKKGIYAITLGEIDSKTDTEVIVKCPQLPVFQTSRKIYFFNPRGKKTGEGDFVGSYEGQLKVKMVSKETEFITEPITPVIFF